MQVFESGAGLAIEARHAAVRIGAGFLALVAAHAQRFVDQQHIGGLADALRDQEADDAAALRLLQRRDVARQAALVALFDALLHLRHARQQGLERLALDADGFAGHRGDGGGRARQVADQGHFADVLAGGYIGQHHVAIVHVARDGHRALADQVQAVARLAFAEQGFTRLEGHYRGARHQLGHRRRRRIGRDVGENGAAQEGFVDHPLHRRHRVDQLVHRAARRFHQHAGMAGAHRGGAAPSRDQAHLAEELAGAEGDDVRAVGRGKLDFDLAVDDGVETVAVVVALEDGFAVLRRAHIRVEQELAQLQARQRRQHRHALLHQLQRRVDRGEAGQGAELAAQQRLVGRLDLVAENELDHLIALVHRLFDQREAGEGADDVQARHVRLVGAGYRRQAGRIGRGKDHAAGFDELARRRGAEAGDDAVAGQVHFAGGGVQHHHAARAPFGLILGGARAAVVEALDAAVGDGLEDGGVVGRLGAIEFVAAVDDDDLVVLGQGDGILDRRVAGADDDDGLAVVFVRIVELILHELRVLAGTAEFADIALHADGQHHMLGSDDAAVTDLEGEGAARAAQRGDFAAQALVDLETAGFLVPLVENLLALAGGERHRAAQRQDRRLRHHVFTLLIAVNGVGQVGLGFEQHM